jgi:hypothetical protein
MSNWTVTATSGTTAADPGYPYIVDIVLQAPDDATFLSVFGQSVIDIFWGTGDCSNDALLAALQVGGSSAPPLGVPEPVTLFLFGAGLAGAAVLRRRRKARGAA